MKQILLLTIAAVANGAVFETYYGTPRSPQPPAQEIRTSAPETAAPQPTQPTPPRVIDIGERTPQSPPPRVIETQPSAPRVIEIRPQQSAPTRSPQPRTPTQIRQTELESAPHGSFGWGGNYLIKATAGFSDLDRAVTVNTTNTGENVICTPTGRVIGQADTSKLGCSDSEKAFRFQLGFGYQLPDDGNYWLVEYAQGKSETKELAFDFYYTLPSLRIANTVPFIKIGTYLGYGDSEKLSPSSLGFVGGIGGYNYLTDAPRLRLEYGLDFSREEWLKIAHTYGDEYWRDTRWHLYIGLAYRFGVE
ncbi:hypothetical protein AGMMS50229_01680 [Campylobacterota bacterium]|nr:hypothetical protein AGMMS50229_01680 [Campylobacterota bacterium]